MRHPLDYFQHIYIINLASRPDRLRQMTAELKRIGRDINGEGFTIFTAIAPQTLDGFPTLGAHGCFLSHLGVLEKSMEAGFERVLVLEDDTDFVADFNEESSKVIDRLSREEWGFFYGSYFLEGDPPPTTSGLVQLPSDRRLINAQFVAYQGDVIRGLRDQLKEMLNRPSGHPEGGPMHVDGAFSWFRQKNPHVQTWIASPQLSFERPSRTDVHDLRWFDRIQGVSQAAAILRNLRWKYRTRARARPEEKA